MEWKKRNKGFNNVKDYFLNNMGVGSLEDVNGWFKTSIQNMYHVEGLDSAILFLKEFVNKPVYIIGDYDVDGVCATSILYRGLREYGFTDVHFRIPRRFSEGFGINVSIIDEINEKEALILTCDNGIAGHEAIALAKKRGLSVIITDHHQPVLDENGQILLPSADRIVNPHVYSHEGDFLEYCGAGLAYKLIVNLFDFDNDVRTRYLPYAALATVCDCVALREENYVFVRQGLKLMSNPATCPMPLRKLLKVFGFENGNVVTETDLAFKIGPAINSCSRMNDTGANKAVELLISEEETLTTVLADTLFITNLQRKTAEAETTERVISYIDEKGLQNNGPILAVVDDAHEGVIGIVASTIAERYRTPAFIFTKKTVTSNSDEIVVYKGSGRSYGEYNIKEELDKFADLIYAYGGHKGAAGITVLPENFDTLSNELNLSNPFKKNSFEEYLSWDVEITADEVPDAISELKKYAPWGEGNPLPQFHVTNFVPGLSYGVYYKIMGEKADCIKIFGPEGSNCSAVAFHLDTLPVVNGDPLEFIAELDDSVFRGSVTHQIRFMDLKS